MAQAINMQEIGAPGLSQFGGRIYEEQLAELRGYRWRRVLRDMLDTDPTIGALSYATHMLMRQVSWHIVARDESAEGEQARLFVEQCLADMRRSWQMTLDEIASFLDWGWADLEIVYKRRLGESRDEEIRPSSQYDDGKIGWAGWEIRGQETVLHWLFSESSGRAIGFVQLPPPDYTERSVPFALNGVAKTLHFQTISRKGNPEGRSMYRSAYRPWYFARQIEQIEGIGIERDLAGLPVAYVPPEILSPTATAEEKATLAAIQRIVTNIRRDEQEGLVFPLAYDERGNELYKIELLSTGGSRQFDTDKVIQRYRSQIAMTSLGDFILLGHEKVGSYALGASKADLYCTALNAFLDHICEEVNLRAIPSLMRLNGMPIESAPRLEHGDAQRMDLGVLGEFLQALNTAGADPFGMDTTGDLRRFVFAQAGLPVPSPEALQEAQQRREEQQASAQAALLAAQQNPKAAPSESPERPDGATND